MLGIAPVISLDPTKQKGSLGPAYHRGWFSAFHWNVRKADCFIKSSSLATLSDIHKRIRHELKRKQPYENFGQLLEEEYHGEGHASIAKDCSTSPGQYGPMWFSEASARDPVFYRWHGHIDDLAQEFRDRHLTP